MKSIKFQSGLRILGGIKKINFKFCACILIFGAAFTARAVKGLSIVKDGQAKCVIVIPDKTVKAVEKAASELQLHILKSSGCKLPIIKESKKNKKTSTSYIYLGACSETLNNKIDAAMLPPNSFIIKTLADGIFISGHDSKGSIKPNSTTRMGTLLGVYEFLEKQIGVKWLWPGELGTVVPTAKDIIVTQWDQTEIPRLKHNRWRNGITRRFPEAWSSEGARKKYMDEESLWLIRQKFIVGTPMNMSHSFVKYWDRFGKPHPEYFNMLPDGTRRPDSKMVRHVSMDVSNPVLWKQIIADWQIKKWPHNQPYIDLSENDTPGKCVCPKCLSWDVPDPSSKVPWDKRLDMAREAFKNKDPKWERYLGELSDRYARYYLSVQKEAEKIDPEAVVMGYAYANYTKPPIKTKLNKRVIIGIVPKLMFPWTDKMRNDFKTQWKGWAATGASLVLRPNYTLCGHCFPIFYADKLGEDIAFCSKNGMIGTDFDSLTGQWAVQGPNLYMLPRIINNPDKPVDQILDEYYSAFGPAKGKIKEYFELWKMVSDSITDESWERIEGTWDFYTTADKIFTPDVMKKGFAILAQAKKAAESDKTALQRIAFLEKGLRNSQLTMDAHAALKKYKKNGDIDSFKTAVQKLDGFRQDYEKDNIANMGSLINRERTRWPRKAIGKEWGESLDIMWSFAFDPEKNGKKKGWQEDGFDDSSWIKVPVTDFWTKSSGGKKWKQKHGEDFKGTAWYRTAFSLDPQSKPCLYYLIFGAVHGPCTVWVNGKLAFERPYQGATNAFLRGPFQVDISSLIRFDKSNKVAVMAEYVDGAGGMWKPVRLYVAEEAENKKSNLIPDPGFDASETTWKTSVMKGQCELKMDENEKFRGKASASIKCLKLDPKNKSSWARWYRKDIPVEKGKSYILRLWTKSSPDFIGKISVWCGKEEKVNFKSTNGLWRQLSIGEIKADDSTLPIYLNLLDGTGAVWFDNLELIEKK